MLIFFTFTTVLGLVKFHNQRHEYVPEAFSPESTSHIFVHAQLLWRRMVVLAIIHGIVHRMRVQVRRAAEILRTFI